MAKPHILPDRCVRGLSRWVACRDCERSCPKGAVLLGEKPFSLSVSEACDGCGLCWTRCPVEALLPPVHGADAVRSDLVILCRKTDRKEKEMPEGAALSVPCSKEIGFRFLAARWMAGLRRLVVEGADCSGCDVVFPPGGENGVDRVNEILRVAGQGPIEVVPAGLRGRSEDRSGAGRDEREGRATSRRGLLKALVAGSLGAALPPARQGPAEEEKAFIAFLKTLDGLCGRKGERGEGRRLAAYRLSVDTRLCYGCKVCATLCPGGALVWEEDPAPPGRALMRVDPSRCLGCGVCRDLCDVGAVDCAFEPGLASGQEILFRERRCRACDRPFLSPRPEGDLCPGCGTYDRGLRRVGMTGGIDETRRGSGRKEAFGPT